MTLKGNIALVTGASRGIGQAIALELGKQGACVIGTATTEQGAANISQNLQQAEIQGQGMVLNVTDLESMDNLVKQVQADFAAPSLLINNAGITRDNLFMRMKPAEWEDVINTNLSSVYHMTKACLKPMMKARFGRIVNISSVVGVSGNPGQANYSAAKAGIIGFSKSLAQELGSRNITVNCVAPGFIDTDMTQALSDKQKQAMLAHIPLNRLGSVEDIASVVSFLVSSAAAYITGETIHVNGGMYMN